MRRRLRPLAVLLLAVAGCVRPAPRAAGSAAVEARLATVEAELGRYREALEFLQKVFEQQRRQADAGDDDEAAPDAIFAIDLAGSPVDGPADAPVTIVEAFDFACPFCAKASPVLDALVRDTGGKVRVVYKNLVVHPQIATEAHLASCGAHQQGKYQEFRRAVWADAFAAYSAGGDPSKLGKASMLAIAGRLGLDAPRLEAAMASDACRAWLAADAAELERFHVGATPTFFVNGTMVQGLLPLAEFRELVEAKAEKVKASGVPAKDYYQAEIFAKGERAFRAKGARR